MNLDCTLLGFTIRRLETRHYDFHKPGSVVITIDSILSPPYPSLKRAETHGIIGNIFKLKGYDVFDEAGYADVRYSFDQIKAIFDKISKKDKIKYGIFGYAPENSVYLDIYNFIFNIRLSYSELEQKRYNIDQNTMKFCGYDVIWADSVWLSTLTNCEVDWKIAEKFGQLNINNLFNGYLDAKCYAEKYKELDEDHFPCDVWGIYKVVL